jgi:hypothetical protein
LNAEPKDKEAFQRQVEAVCQCYREAANQLELGIHTASVDEKTGIQALERIAATKLMKAKQEERREYEYKRHGTICLTANLEVATGKVISPTVEATRTEEEFATHIARTVATDAEAGWIFVADNLTTHVSETLAQIACGRAVTPDAQSFQSFVLVAKDVFASGRRPGFGDPLQGGGHARLLTFEFAQHRTHMPHEDAAVPEILAR